MGVDTLDLGPPFGPVGGAVGDQRPLRLPNVLNVLRKPPFKGPNIYY